MPAMVQPFKPSSLTNVMSDEQRASLARMSPYLHPHEMYRLGFPAVAGVLTAPASERFAAEPCLSKIETGASWKELDYPHADMHETAELLTREMARPSLFIYMPKAGVDSQPGQQKVKGITPIVSDILSFDQRTFSDSRVFILVDFEHKLVAPGKTRTPAWHADCDDQEHPPHMRIYAMRSNFETDFIREEGGYNKEGKLHPVLDCIRSIHTLPRDMYGKWEKTVKELGLFWRPPANAVTVFTKRTYHRSHEPERTGYSSFLRVFVTPLPC